MKTVFVLQHSYELEGCDETKFIGVYSSHEEAQQAILRIKNKPGFRLRQNDFHATEYEINKDQWVDGFFTASGED
jgi:hypothetical protein